MRTRAFVAVVVTGMLLASCGGGSGAVTAPNTPKQLAADKLIAKQALLTAADLPAGYTGTPHVDSSDSNPPPAVLAAFAKCSGLPKRFLDDSTDDQPHADAPDFARGKVGQGPATEVDSSIELDRSSKDISGPLTHLSGAAKCFQPVFKAIFTEALKSAVGVSFSDVSVSNVAIGSVGDQAAGFQGSVTISGTGLSIPLEFDLFFVRTGRAAVELTAIASDTQVDQTLAKALLEKMVGRLKAAT